MGIQRRSSQGIYRLQKKLMIQLGERSGIIFSLSLLIHETGKVNKNESD